MSSFNKLSNQHNNREIQVEISKFLAYNKDEFAELVTFVNFAEKFTLGFIEINFAPDVDLLILGLQQNPQCQEIQFVLLEFSNENLRFLRDELVLQLAQIQPEANKKLVLLIRDLEKSIGVFGEYPPVLQDLNFIRDSYRQTVPHPILFLLPDYAISRLAKFAPDFWAWKSGLFRFKTTESTRDSAIANTLNTSSNIERLPTPEQQERIDLLHRLLMEYNPTGGKPNQEYLDNCGNILNELGKAYLTQHKPTQAREYLTKAWEISKNFPDSSLQIEIINNLGKSYSQQRQFDTAIKYHQQALDIAKNQNNRSAIVYSLFYLGDVSLDIRQFHQARDYYQLVLEIEIEYSDRYSSAGTYHQLGNVAEELREYHQARDYYQKALEIYIEYSDRYSSASSYHQLGRVAEELCEYHQARDYYQKALEIKIEYSDRYSSACTYHQLGMVAQQLREYHQARDYYQKALEIYIEYSDRYSSASTYYQLGKVAEELGLEEAKVNYLQDLVIMAEFNDKYGLEISLRNLARFYQATQDEDFLIEVAKAFGTTVEKLKESIIDTYE